MVVAACLALGAVAMPRLARTQAVDLRQPLSGFPLTVGSWRGLPVPRLAPRIVAALGVDDYLHRVYVNGVDRPVALFIGYRRGHADGSALHSPRNCLPGGGWEPIESTRIRLQVPRSSAEADGTDTQHIDVNRVIVEKGPERQLVLYWYQTRRRVVASEYTAKMYLVIDALRSGRTEAALVRVAAPIASPSSGADDGTARTERAVVAFVSGVFPLLGRHFPE